MYELTPQHATCISQHTHIVLALRFQESFVVKVLLTLVPAEEIAPFTSTHLVNTVILHVWDVPHVVEIC